jgi:hypothetical protein
MKAGREGGISGEEEGFMTIGEVFHTFKRIP